MNERKSNHCIECSVRECKYHSCCDDYCTLEKIRIGSHEANPTVDQCTDCKSFSR